MTYTYVLPDDPKMLRETLCVLQAAFNHSDFAMDHRATGHRERLQRLIDECDRMRPLGPDGKHGSRHTMQCGCEPTEAWAACPRCHEVYICDLDLDDVWPIRGAVEEAQMHVCRYVAPRQLDVGIIA